MCFPIPDHEARYKECKYGESMATTGWIEQLTRYRNTRRKDDGLTVFGSRLAGAIGYPALALAVAVECAVRSAFALLALIPSAIYIFCDDGELFGNVVVEILLPIVGIEHILRCAVGFFKNFYKHQLDFQELAIGQCLYPEAMRTNKA